MTVEELLCAFYMANLAVFITADILHGVKNDRRTLRFPRRVLGLSGGVGCRDIRGKLARGIFGVHSLEPGDGGGDSGGYIQITQSGIQELQGRGTT